ncbi:MAG: sigma-54-dependent Fis family transcriptional regulator [Comamonadaceae bacterium]|nr:MAG: sigma-54-dependent Fis family transcriptional regulator [Comamonadaceae bacterium]
MSSPRHVLLVAPPPCTDLLLPELGKFGWLAHPVSDLSAAADVLATQKFDVALLILDSNHPDSSKHFDACVTVAGHCEWVGVFPRGESLKSPWREHILTHFFDHHTYPANLTFLCQSLGHAWGRAALRATRDSENHDGGDMGMVGQSAALMRLRAEIRKAGRADAPVLIAGESGSGKELVARALHRCSRRSRGPFVPVNCGALPPNLIQSELFGHERGSFTGANSSRHGVIEAASGGTLFLDEIAELPLETQATLLRFLQERKIVRVGSVNEIEADTRVLAASHVDLAGAVAAGTFRADLYFRLNVLSLWVPPLRERREDIALLARFVHERTSAGHAAAARGFNAEAMAAMTAYDWPGNVRELFNRVQRAVVMAEHALIRPVDLGLAPECASIAENLEDVRVEAERSAIHNSLERVSHNVTRAARELGVSRMTLYRLMAKHSISPRAV